MSLVFYLFKMKGNLFTFLKIPGEISHSGMERVTPSVTHLICPRAYTKPMSADHFVIYIGI